MEHETQDPMLVARRDIDPFDQGARQRPLPADAAHGGVEQVVHERVAKEHGHGQQRSPGVEQQQAAEDHAGHQQPPERGVGPVVVMPDLPPTAAVLERQVEVDQIEVGQHAADERARGDGLGPLRLGDELRGEVAGRQVRDEHGAWATSAGRAPIPGWRARCATA
jgi:hypothetical protein